MGMLKNNKFLNYKIKTINFKLINSFSVYKYCKKLCQFYLLNNLSKIKKNSIEPDERHISIELTKDVHVFNGHVYLLDDNIVFFYIILKRFNISIPFNQVILKTLILNLVSSCNMQSSTLKIKIKLAMLGNNHMTSGSDLNIILLPYRSPRASLVHFVDYRFLNRSKSIEEILFFNKISTELSTRFESDLTLFLPRDLSLAYFSGCIVVLSVDRLILIRNGTVYTNPNFKRVLVRLVKSYLFEFYKNDKSFNILFTSSIFNLKKTPLLEAIFLSDSLEMYKIDRFEEKKLQYMHEFSLKRVIEKIIFDELCPINRDKFVNCMPNPMNQDLKIN